MAMEPFADEASALQVGGLKIENRLDRVSLYGSLDLTRDKAGLRLARELHTILEAVVAALQREDTALPETVQTAQGEDTVKNPFG
ncbi:hypothetical protein [Dankookia rubra]|nr:hypothetical protein [Dankookia rubra]